MSTKPFKWLIALPAIYLLCCSISYAQSKPAQLQINTKQDMDAGRVRIDSLDARLITILGEREQIAKAIGVYKAKNNIPPLQEARFKQVVQKTIAEGNKVGLSPEFITELMNAIHKESLRIEDAVKSGNPQ
jgi:chorismate mutase